MATASAGSSQGAFLVTLPEGFARFATHIYKTMRPYRPFLSNYLTSIAGPIAAATNSRIFVIGNGVLLLSADGGTTWNPVLKAQSANGQITNVAFSSPNCGIATATNMSLYRTEDGGNTWQMQKLDDSGGQLGIISLLDDTHGLVGGVGGAIFRTADGHTWTRSGIPLTGDILGMQCRGPLEVWAWARTITTEKQYLDDEAYANWEDAGYSPGTALDDWLKAERTLESTGGILRSLDGGQTWNVVHTPVEAWSVEPVDEANVYAYCSGGITLHSSDQGRSWTQLPTGTSDPGHVITPGKGWRYGYANQRGYVAVTVDAGMHWKETALSTNGVVGLTTLDGNDVWVSCGTYGGTAVVHSADGGHNWDLQVSVPYIDHSVSVV